jgi:hypothetical protein
MKTSAKIEKTSLGGIIMMEKRKELLLYAGWICLYILCVGLGTVGNMEGVGKVFFVLTSLIFFLPGAWLLGMSIKNKKRKTVLRVRIIAICSLALTVIVFCANVAAAAAGEVSPFLNDLLNLVSAPMFCSQYWILSLFCWACLLSASFMRIGDK